MIFRKNLVGIRCVPYVCTTVSMTVLASENRVELSNDYRRCPVVALSLLLYYHRMVHRTRLCLWEHSCRLSFSQ